MTKKIPQLFDFCPYYGLLCVEGADAFKLLQGQLTCDVSAINETYSQLGAHCNPKGRIITFFRLFLFQGKYYLLMPRESVSVAMNALKKYAVFFKVTLSDASTVFAMKGYITAAPSSDFPQKINEAVDHTHFIVIKVAEGKYEIIGESDAITAFLNTPIQTADISAWEQIRIHHKVPSIHPETSERFLPHELDIPKLLNAVSFKKGCYTGQEIIARMEYRGKVKTQLMTALIESPTAPIRGQDVFTSTETCGSVVDYVQTGDNQYELLILMNPIDRALPVALEPEQKTLLKFTEG